MNDFFGDIKHNRVAPVYTPEITNRLAGLNHILPVIQGGAAAVDYQAPVANHAHYQLPQLANLRTKSELLDGENFLNALSNTLYESANTAAAAGIHQPGMHYAAAQLGFRSSQSPPQHALHTPPHHRSPAARVSPPGTSASMMAHESSRSSHGTAVLTPPLAPHSLHQTSMGHSSAASYPSLAALASGESSVTYTATAGSAPISSVDSSFDRNKGQRVSTGLLQRAAPGLEDFERISESPSPKLRSPSQASDRLAEGLKTVEISSSLIDPMLAGEDKGKGRRSNSGSSASDKNDKWLEAIRVVEVLKDFVAKRLADRDYVAEGRSSGSHSPETRTSDTPMRETSELEKDHQRLYPILKAVVDGE
jgi:hypothetical protein